MAANFNQRNPAVRRIVAELKELQREADPDLLAEAIEDNIFEWHFVIRGAWDSEFEGGIYHGRILMPAEYPFKPPAFVMLTPSGRFETGVKICLSISSHHPESWQPSWSVRSALVALIAFMQTPGNGALGSLDHPADARRQMAAESRGKPPAYGAAERQQLIEDMHRRMLEMEPRSRQQCNLEQQPGAAAEGSAASPGSPASAATASSPAASPVSTVASSAAALSPATDPSPASSPASSLLSAQQDAASPSPATPLSPAALPAELRQRAAGVAPMPAWAATAAPPPAAAAARQQSWEDRGLTYLAVLLALCIAALVIRKVVVAFSFRSDDLFAFDHVEGVNMEGLEL